MISAAPPVSIPGEEAVAAPPKAAPVVAGAPARGVPDVDADAEYRAFMAWSGLTRARLLPPGPGTCLPSLPHPEKMTRVNQEIHATDGGVRRTARLIDRCLKPPPSREVFSFWRKLANKCVT
ncbi:hypothetical protein PAPYR_7719 [Paratrimastix pyriformis]|uniref:Uncharacterized protein n=1 Tax=Paratrimastix pyriformis TaxID=342808 RepID=A0ABQ8UHV9_9EUKA|nr:hypothetical protein PAPYR_7719 [Paratrimastix pyriformis]